MSHSDSASISGAAETLTMAQRFWRNRLFARIRHRGTAMRRLSGWLTRGHAVAIRWSGGRIRRSFLFTGGMPVLVLTTIGRKTGKPRTTPLCYLRVGNDFAVLASNAGSDRMPAWWLNLQARPAGHVLADRSRYTVEARTATPDETDKLWDTITRMNPGFDEYRQLTERQIPIVLLRPVSEKGP
ncbi:nitroreductase/quinone reductase family protein [Nocardia colli]|nr:nitroreductase/quinone reductase family protein [Nocardia colli]